MQKKSFTVKQPNKLIKFLSKECPDISYSEMRKILRNKDVKINGKRTDKDVDLAVSDVVEIFYVGTEKVMFNTLYSDDNVVVVDKFSGFTSEEVFEKLKSLYGGVCFIHRLDRNTKGVMIFALNGDAESELLLGFKNRTFEKSYIATVKGILNRKSAVLSAYLIKDKDAATVKIYDVPRRGAVEIKTGYTVIEEKNDVSVLEVALYTGKTHQIRAHLAFIGHPIVGDGKYGDNEFNKRKGAKRQMLTAKRLTLNFDCKDKLFYLNQRTFISEN